MKKSIKKIIISLMMLLFGGGIALSLFLSEDASFSSSAEEDATLRCKIAVHDEIIYLSEKNLPERKNTSEKNKPEKDTLPGIDGINVTETIASVLINAAKEEKIRELRVKEIITHVEEWEAAGRSGAVSLMEEPVFVETGRQVATAPEEGAKISAGQGVLAISSGKRKGTGLGETGRSGKRYEITEVEEDHIEVVKILDGENCQERTYGRKTQDI